MSNAELIRVEIGNQQTQLAIDTAFLEEVARQTLSHEQVASAEISIAIVDNQTIHALNRQHLDHDFPTDVLSFLLSEERIDHLEGEVVVSAEMACQTADGYQWSPQSELLLYLVHGLLHLCGYDDHDDTDRNRMRSREQEILRVWNLEPQYHQE